MIFWFHFFAKLPLKYLFIKKHIKPRVRLKKQKGIVFFYGT